VDEIALGVPVHPDGALTVGARRQAAERVLRAAEGDVGRGVVGAADDDRLGELLPPGGGQVGEPLARCGHARQAQALGLDHKLVYAPVIEVDNHHGSANSLPDGASRPQREEPRVSHRSQGDVEAEQCAGELVQVVRGATARSPARAMRTPTLVAASVSSGIRAGRRAWRRWRGRW